MNRPGESTALGYEETALGDGSEKKMQLRMLVEEMQTTMEVKQP